MKKNFLNKYILPASGLILFASYSLADAAPPLTAADMDSVKTSLKGDIEGSKNTINGTIEGAKNSINGAIDGAKNNLKDTLDGVKTNLQQRIQSSQDTLNTRLNTLKTGMDDEIKKLNTFVTSEEEKSRTHVSEKTRQLKEDLNKEIKEHVTNKNQEVKTHVSEENKQLKEDLNKEINEKAKEIKAHVTKERQLINTNTDSVGRNIRNHVTSESGGIKSHVSATGVGINQHTTEKTSEIIDLLTSQFNQIRKDQNQISVGNALKEEHSSIYRNKSANEIVKINNFLSAEIHPSIASFLVESSSDTRNPLKSRIQSNFNESKKDEKTITYEVCKKDLKKCKQNNILSTSSYGFNIWGSGIYSNGLLAGDQNASSLKYESKNGFIGADISSDAIIIGGTAGFGYSDLSVGKLLSYGDVKNNHLGVYIGAAFGDVIAYAGSTYTMANIETQRSVYIPESENLEKVKAFYDANVTDNFVELSYRLNYAKLSLEPFLNFVNTSVRMNPYKETNYSTSISGHEIQDSKNFATVGLRISDTIAFTQTHAIIHGMAGWRYAFGELPFSNAHKFYNLPKTQHFTVKGVPVLQNAFLFNAGVDLRVVKALSFDVSYNAEVAQEAWKNSLNLSMKFTF